MSSTHDGPIPYLSDRWVAEADAALSTLTPVPGPLVVGVTVTGTPDGDRSHRLVLGPDRVGVARGTEGASVTMTMPWDLAVAVSQGRASAQRAFLDGQLVLEGDPVVLLGYQEELAAVEDVLGALRARTRYPG